MGGNFKENEGRNYINENRKKMGIFIFRVLNIVNGFVIYF